MHIYCARAFFALLDFKFYLLAVTKDVVEAQIVNVAAVNEYVAAAVLGFDKTESLFEAEPLNCSCSHVLYCL